MNKNSTLKIQKPSKSSDSEIETATNKIRAAIKNLSRCSASDPDGFRERDERRKESVEPVLGGAVGGGTAGGWRR